MYLGVENLLTDMIYRFGLEGLALSSSGFFDVLGRVTDYIKKIMIKITELNISEALGIEHFTDYIDFFLLTVLVFCVLKYLKNSRSGKMVGGIAIILIVYLLSILMNLHTVSFVIRCILQGGAVVFVVLFAQEIRRGLEKLGTLPQLLLGFRYHRGGKEEQTMRLMDAITAISLSEKMGALIVIEGYTKLDEHMEKNKGHNTIVDADITTELLKTIFMNGTELHDGGLIIRRGRVYAASCYFQPTQNFDYVNHINTMSGHKLGSRHQAAIGLSEQSDATVIIISEETHAMSVSYGGEIFMDLSTDQLTAIVRAAMVGSGKDLKRAIDKIKGVKVH